MRQHSLVLQQYHSEHKREDVDLHRDFRRLKLAFDNDWSETDVR
jgi:hypothetical protein